MTYREPPPGTVRVDATLLQRIQSVLLNIGAMPAECVPDVPHWPDEGAPRRGCTSPRSSDPTALTYMVRS